MPGAIARRAGEVGSALLDGLLDFAKDAVKILAASTAIGALIGALFGGVGAIPGAEIGFEIGLLILEYYGLGMLIAAVLSIAVDLVAQLATFVKLVWDANGDKKQLDLAARALAEAIGILASAALIAFAAYLLKEGGKALGKTKFAQTVGETRLAKWLKERQRLTTTRTKAKELGTEGGKTVLAEEPTVDGRHKVKVTEDGIVTCSPSCPLLIKEIDEALLEDPGLREKLEPLRKELEAAQGKVEAARIREDRASSAEERTKAAAEVEEAAKNAASVAARVKPQLDAILKAAPLPSGFRFDEFETPEAAIGMHEGQAKLVGKGPVTEEFLIKQGYTERRYYRDNHDTKWSVDVRSVGRKTAYRKAHPSSGQDVD